jgi:hypothetical protein
MPSADKGLGVTTRLLKKWPGPQNSNCYKKGIEALVSRWCKAVEVDEDYKLLHQSCIYGLIAPEDGRKHRPKHVELI